MARIVRHTTYVTIPNPDNIFDMPFYEGCVDDAHHMISPGTYVAYNMADESQKIIVTVTYTRTDAVYAD